MRRRILPILLFLLVISLTAAAAGQNVEAALNTQYGGKILALRHSLEKNSQVYDSTGKMLKGGDEGPWTLYGRFLVKKLRVDKNSLLVEGQRLFYVRAGDVLAPAQSPEKLKVEIKLVQPLASVEEANGLLGQVFCLTDEDVVKSAPRIWQNYLSAQLLHVPVADSATEPEKLKGKGLVVVELDGAGDAVKHEKTRVPLRDGVTWPRATFTPDPEYSDAARRQRYQGTLVLGMVIDATGKVRAPNIIRPLGMGLDENAVKKVLTWRFDPGKVDGKAVAVEMNVEVSFNLY